MARVWTTAEEKEKRDELQSLYVVQNKTIGEIGFGNLKHQLRAQKFLDYVK